MRIKTSKKIKDLACLKVRRKSDGKFARRDYRVAWGIGHQYRVWYVKEACSLLWLAAGRFIWSLGSVPVNDLQLILFYDLNGHVIVDGNDINENMTLTQLQAMARSALEDILKELEEQ